MFLGVYLLAFWLILVGISTVFGWVFGSVFARLFTNFSGYLGFVWMGFWECFCWVSVRINSGFMGTFLIFDSLIYGFVVVMVNSNSGCCGVCGSGISL